MMCEMCANIITYGHVIKYVQFQILPIWNSYGSHVDDNPSDINGKRWSSAGEQQSFGLNILSKPLLFYKNHNQLFVLLYEYITLFYKHKCAMNISHAAIVS